MPDTFQVTAIQRLCLHDGPGVRTTVFLKGCSLDCPWCCNPETKYGSASYFHYPQKCIYLNGDMQNALCQGCTSKENSKCPFGAWVPTIHTFSTDELFGRIVVDKIYYGNGGGVTFSGGEPLLQAKLLIPLLEKLKANNVSIYFETSLYVPYENVLLTEPFTDGYIVDFKIINRPFISNYQLFDVGRNIAYLSSKVKISVVRMVLIKNLTDTKENIDLLKVLYNDYPLPPPEFLQYHTLGFKKLDCLNIPQVEFVSSPLERIAQILEEWPNSKYTTL